MIDGRRRLMMRALRSGGSGVTVETVSFTVPSNSASHKVPISGDVNKILFAHLYDEDAVYTTTGTTYEGCIIGRALAHFQAMKDNTSWSFLRTNAAGTSTGWNNYGNHTPFNDDGYIYVSSNPTLTVGHNIVITIFYAE